jgi:hypothetical protein
MIVNIVVGETDSGNNPIQVFSSLEGPLSYEQLKDMWDTFEGNIEATIGDPPQQPFHIPSAEEKKEFKKVYKTWSDDRNEIHRQLKETWNLPQETDGYLITRYFIEFLIKHHGYSRVETVELFTEDY